MNKYYVFIFSLLISNIIHTADNQIIKYNNEMDKSVSALEIREYIIMPYEKLSYVRMIQNENIKESLYFHNTMITTTTDGVATIGTSTERNLYTIKLDPNQEAILNVLENIHNLKQDKNYIVYGDGLEINLSQSSKSVEKKIAQHLDKTLMIKLAEELDARKRKESEDKVSQHTRKDFYFPASREFSCSLQ